MDIIFEKYKGTLDKPTNFDNYWERKKELAKKIQLDYTLTKRNFSHENISYFDLYFKSYDGSKIYAKYLKNEYFRKENPNVKIPVLFYFHGYPASSRNWLEKTAYCSLGYDVIAMDFRGQGGLSEDIISSEFGTVFGHLTRGLNKNIEDMIIFKNIIDSLVLVRIISSFKDIDEYNLNTIGASQGAAFSLILASLNKNVKKCVALYPFLSDFSRMLNSTKSTAYDELKLYSRWFSPKGLHNDIIENKLAYIDTKNFVSKISANVLFGITLLDTDCPPETQYAVFNNITSKKILHVYKKFKHEEILDFKNKVLNFLL